MENKKLEYRKFINEKGESENETQVIIKCSRSN